MLRCGIGRESRGPGLSPRQVRCMEYAEVGVGCDGYRDLFCASGFLAGCFRRFKCSLPPVVPPKLAALP